LNAAISQQATLTTTSHPAMTNQTVHPLSDLDHQEVIRWSACEMALAASEDWDVDESGWQVVVPGTVMWTHPSVPFLQVIELVAHLADGRVFSLLSQCDDSSRSYGLCLFKREPAWLLAKDTEANIYRTREVPKLPVGLITKVALSQDSTECIPEMLCTIDFKVVRFLSGELHEREGGRLEIVEQDESILIQVDGKMPTPLSFL
jgi:hypothetical protein